MNIKISYLYLIQNIIFTFEDITYLKQVSEIKARENIHLTNKVLGKAVANKMLFIGLFNIYTNLWNLNIFLLFMLLMLKIL